ncbi:hypothetical protein Ciccas_003246 [Cichlidogyrus casuarinus]|uniref:C2H2-type domain-containing protein n=1 Tax=Cichlidogyrus casuarinus TaxID=1844966 RepID=A0ABD2QEX2_9PLAT
MKELDTFDGNTLKNRTMLTIGGNSLSSSLYPMYQSNPMPYLYLGPDGQVYGLMPNVANSGLINLQQQLMFSSLPQMSLDAPSSASYFVPTDAALADSLAKVLVDRNADDSEKPDRAPGCFICKKCGRKCRTPAGLAAHKRCCDFIRKNI